MEGREVAREEERGRGKVGRGEGERGRGKTGRGKEERKWRREGN